LKVYITANTKAAYEKLFELDQIEFLPNPPEIHYKVCPAILFYFLILYCCLHISAVKDLTPKEAVEKVLQINPKSTVIKQLKRKGILQEILYPELVEERARRAAERAKREKERQERIQRAIQRTEEREIRAKEIEERKKQQQEQYELLMKSTGRKQVNIGLEDRQKDRRSTNNNNLGEKKWKASEGKTQKANFYSTNDGESNNDDNNDEYYKVEEQKRSQGLYQQQVFRPPISSTQDALEDDYRFVTICFLTFLYP
jgi:hypothetical protein